MKTLRIFILIITGFLLIPSFVVHADIIIEPENDFYKQHAGEMVYLNRRFVANGADGFASFRETPGLKNDINKLQNGEETDIQYSCLYEGDYWGYSMMHRGWIQMDQLLVLYDYIAFEEEHFDELYL